MNFQLRPGAWLKMCNVTVISRVTNIDPSSRGNGSLIHLKVIWKLSQLSYLLHWLDLDLDLDIYIYLAYKSVIIGH